MSTKITHQDTFKTILSAVNKMVDFIKPTFGASSNKIIIDKLAWRMVCDDGVQAARDFELEDPSENAVVKLIREVAIKTNDRVGDGTTGAMIIAQAIINEVAKKPSFDGRKVELEIKKGLVEVKEALLKASKQIKTKEDLKKVAKISFDDEKVATMLSDIYYKIGKDGVITIDKSPTMETYPEMSQGIKIDRGYISPYMITNPERMESVIEKPYILFTDYRITEINDIIPLMNKMAEANKRDLVVICENMEQSALATAVANRLQGKFLLIAVTAPTDGDRTIILEDMALATGAKMFTASKGDKLELAEIKDLGRAERFICKREESIIIAPKGDKKNILMTIAQLESAIQSEENESQKKELLKRLGMFKNSIAVIKVGAPTEQEQKTLKYKVEDAVNSVKAAYKGGVVCGAGLMLSRITTSSPILNKALKYPSQQILINAGMDEIPLKEDEAYNFVSKKQGNYFEVGVIDPTDVLIAAVESAVSIASILLTSSGMIVESQDKE